MLLIDVDVLKGKKKEAEEEIYDCDQCITTHSAADNTLDIPYICPVSGADLRPKHYKYEEEEDE